MICQLYTACMCNFLYQRWSTDLNISDFRNIILYIILIYRRYSFVLRIVLLLLAAWMTLLVFNSASVVLPISLGRVLFNAVPVTPFTHGIKCNGERKDPTGFTQFSIVFFG